MRHLGTWFSGELSSAELMVRLNDLKGLFQPKQFYDYILNRIQERWRNSELEIFSCHLLPKNVCGYCNLKMTYYCLISQRGKE